LVIAVTKNAATNKQLRKIVHYTLPFSSQITTIQLKQDYRYSAVWNDNFVSTQKYHTNNVDKLHISVNSVTNSRHRQQFWADRVKYLMNFGQFLSKNAATNEQLTK